MIFPKKLRRLRPGLSPVSQSPARSWAGRNPFRGGRAQGLGLLGSALLAGALLAADDQEPSAVSPLPAAVATTNPAAPVTNATAGVTSPGGRRTFTWQNLELPEYGDYLKALRAAGCPENRLRELVVGDVNELFDQKRLQEAMEFDVQWWKSNAVLRVAAEIEAEQQLGRETLRAELLARHLGANQTNKFKLLPLVSGLRHALTGPVLGVFPLEKHSRVIEITLELPKRLRAYQAACQAEGRPRDPVEEVKMREEMRSQLRQVLTPGELEEYLVRTSATAATLRQDLRAFNPSEEEFKKVFRVLDPLKVRMQLEYGQERALSLRQRDEFQKDCDQVVQEVLPPERFKLYLVSRDPSYQQAVRQAANYKLDEKAIWRLYEAYREQAAKRDKIMEDKNLTPEEREQALRSSAQDAQNLLTDLITAQQAVKQVP
jgi:hypothetical protein